MASSTHKMYSTTTTTTTAPPPTPSSSQSTTHHLASSSAMDALSRLLHRLPPTLSLPTRRNSSLSTTSPPLISLSDQPPIDPLLSASSQLGFFQLTSHNIPSHLANSAELESLSLFKLTKDQKESCFVKNWPFGFNENDDDDGNGESFWLDSDCSASTELSTELSLSSLRELTRGLEKVGLQIIDTLSCAVEFDNPFKEDPTRYWSLMIVHEGLYEDKPDHIPCGFYPYVVGLQYEIRSRKYSLLADSGWVTVVPQVDSVMVTIGDIAQVWSNGKLKKVRGRPLPCMGDGKNSSSITMTLLITLPTETIVTPLLPKPDTAGHNAGEDEVRDEEEGQPEKDEESNDDNINVQKEKRLFSSFSFEDYAWRVYNEPLIFKDPLEKYRIAK